MRVLSTRIQWIRHTNPQLFESALQSGNFWIRFESGIVWRLNPGIFFIRWRNKIESSSLPWILYSRWHPLKVEQDVNFARFTTDVLLPIFPEESWILEWIWIRVRDTSGRANLIWIRIRVDVEIFESGKKKLRIQKYRDTCGRGPCGKLVPHPTTTTIQTSVIFRDFLTIISSFSSDDVFERRTFIFCKGPTKTLDRR